MIELDNSFGLKDKGVFGSHGFPFRENFACLDTYFEKWTGEKSPQEEFLDAQYQFIHYVADYHPNTLTEFSLEYRIKINWLSNTPRNHALGWKLFLVGWSSLGIL